MNASETTKRRSNRHEAAEPSLNTESTREEAPTGDVGKQEMDRRQLRMEEETKRRQDGASKSRPFHRKRVTLDELRKLTRTELEDYAMEIGLRPRDLMLSADRLMANVLNFQWAWVQMILED